jgi:hypothetical protein
LDHRTLRELFRYLQLFEALFETEGVDTLPGPDGEEYCLWDIQALYHRRTELSARQAEAIEMFLYDDMRERDVARLMGVSPVNPVAIYATQGLKRLCLLYDEINRAGADENDADEAPERSQQGAGG